MLSSPAFGSIIVTFGTSSPNPLIAGSSGTIDVFAEASAGTETLDGFQLGVTISGPAGGLLFSAVQTEGQLAIGGATGYVFFGDSVAQNPPTAVGTVSGGGTIYSGYDAVFSSVLFPVPFSGAITLTTTPQLLYRLNLDAVTAGTYTIDAIAALPGNPSFFSDQYDPLGTGISFTSTPGSINVAAAVPEPGSMLFFGFVAVYAGARRWRKQRTSQRSCV